MTICYVLKNFWKKGTFTQKEYLIGFLCWIVFHSLLDLVLAFIFRQNTFMLRTVISLVVMDLIFIRRLRAITQKKWIMVALVIGSLWLSTFLFLFFTLISTSKTENRFIQQDIEKTSAQINKFVEEKHLRKAKIEAQHLINLYENRFGKRTETTEELKNLLSIKLGVL